VLSPGDQKALSNKTDSGISGWSAVANALRSGADAPERRVGIVAAGSASRFELAGRRLEIRTSLPRLQM